MRPLFMIVHWMIAFSALILIGLLISSFIPAPWDTVIMWAYLAASYVLTFSGLNNFRIYNGFGVAGRVNHELGYKLLNVFKLVAKKYVVKPLYNTWLSMLVNGFVILIISYFSKDIVQIELVYKLVSIIGIVFISSALAQIYVWMMFGRKYHWCVAESILKAHLKNRNYDENEIKLIVERLNSKGYVLMGV